MRVKVESYGGFIGHMEGELSSEEMSPQQLQDIEVIERRDANGTSARGSAPTYHVTVTDDQGERLLVVPEAEMPPSLSSIPAPKLE